MVDKEKLLAEIQIDRKETQKQFDSAKLTIATAGLLVALSLNDKWQNESATIALVESYKLTLVLVLSSMLFILLGFLISELSIKWLERFVNKNRLTWWQKIVVRNVSDKSAHRLFKVYGFYRVRLPNFIITVTNNMASVLLVLAILSFGYMVIMT